MSRKLLLSFLVIALGVGLYLSSSGGPLQIHLVEIGFHLLFLLAGSLLAWWQPLRVTSKALLLCGLVVVGAVTRGALLDQVLGKGFAALHPPFLGAGVVLLAAELSFVVAIVWLLDRFLTRLAQQRAA